MIKLTDQSQALIISVISQILIPEIVAVIKYLQAKGEEVNEATITAQLEARGFTVIAKLDAWFEAHPVEPPVVP